MVIQLRVDRNRHPLRIGTHEIDVDGIAQRYHVRGSGAEVCVAVPGGPGLSWEYLRMPAVERRVRVVYVEPLGTGASGRLPSHPDGYTRAVYAEALDRLLDRLGRERVHLLGHCHGGLVAQYYALRHPERLAGLILHMSSPVTGPEQTAETGRQVDRFVRRNQWNPALPAVLDALHAIQDAHDDRALTAATRDALPTQFAHYWARRDELAGLRPKFRRSYLSAPELIDDRAELPGLSVPTLVTAGMYDIVGGTRWARELHQLIPYARLLLLARSGHLGHIEEPERFAEGVLDFVAATPAVHGGKIAA
ncbi:alpha/beta hydrolase [Actinoplanes sp. NPDC049596]|uniref:alpha/beta fold hydrolase n=1 Tax=unclassified Actinoplanes TaxID=2626549 RepID=UPI00341E5895